MDKNQPSAGFCPALEKTFCSFQDEVQETLDKTKESCNEEVTKLDKVKAKMSDLKTHLYAKFGNAIYLENDE